jgi:hypothetical protein
MAGMAAIMKSPGRYHGVLQENVTASLLPLADIGTMSS